MEDNVELKNRLLGITTEVGAGIGTDAATTGLLAGGPWGWLAYAGINFGQGAYTNYLVQKHLYGNENINWGEVIASGGMGMIPFMDIKAGKYARLLGKSNTVQRGIVGGALTGLAGEQVRVGIDEQRFLNPLEAVTSAGVGGVLGGGLTKLSKLGKQSNVVPKFDPTGATDDLMRQQAGLKMRLLKSIDPEDAPGWQQLSLTKRGIKGKNILRSDNPIANFRPKVEGTVVLDEATLVQADKIIDELEAFHDKGLAGALPKWRIDRPTWQYRGNRRVSYTKPDGTSGELYFNWSKRKQTYVARDVDKLTKHMATRAKWNIVSGGKEKAVKDIYGTSRKANKVLNEKLVSLFDEDPELMQKLVGDTNQIVYVEHIHPGRSPYWNRSRSFKPGDPENLLVIEDDIFPKVKTAVEKQLYDTGRYKNVYADMFEGDILLKDATTDEMIGIIPGLTNPSQVKASIYAALTGETPMDLVNINPNLRRYLAKLHGFDKEDFGRLKEVTPGIPSKAQFRFEEIAQELERLEVRLEASRTGTGIKLNQQAEKTLERQIKQLRQKIEQLNLFDTAGEFTGLRAQRKKFKIAKPKRVKRRVDKGQIDTSVQIPIDYQGPKYGK